MNMDNKVFMKELGALKQIMAAIKIDPVRFGVPGQPTNSIMSKAIKLSEHLAIHHYNYRCASCQSIKDLQLHHIVERKYRALLGVQVYFTQRHYWANIILLCDLCHDKIHERTGNSEGAQCISQEKLDRIREKFEKVEK